MPRFRPLPGRGFTLTEMLVASSVMIVLGMGVITILRDTVGVWRDHETIRDEYDRATAVTQQIERDMIAICTDMAREPEWLAGANNSLTPGAPVDVMRPPRARMIIGFDALNRPFIVFTRYMRDEMGSVTRNSGRLGSQAYLGENFGPNYGFLMPYSPTDNLRVLGNLAEIAYCFGPGPRYDLVMSDGQQLTAEWLGPDALDGVEIGEINLTAGGYFSSAGIVLPGAVDKQTFTGHGLYRGSISPPPTPYVDPAGSGYDSLFADFDRPSLAQARSELESRGLSGFQGHFFQSWMRKYQLLSDGVLFVGYQVMMPDANGIWRWTPQEFQSFTDGEPRFGDRDVYDTLDSGIPFPSAIRLSVTVEALSGKPTRSTLSRPFVPGDTELYVRDGFGLPSAAGTHPFLLIGEGRTGTDYEWVWYERASGTHISGIHRGARGTVEAPAAFPAGTPVRWGITFQKVIYMRPSHAPGGGPNATGMATGPTGWTYSEMNRDRSQYEPSEFADAMKEDLLDGDQ